jgi:hypothetical protein
VRISATTLEQFRLFEVEDWMTEDSLIASIKREFVPTHKVELGQAFDAILTDPEPYKVAGGYQCDGFTFGDDIMQPSLAVMDRAGVCQVKATKEYGLHTVVCKADQLLGSRVVENKTTLSSFDFDKYAASYQWRYMLDIFDAPQVTYNVFCLFESAQNGVLELRSIETFDLYRYPRMHQDCADLVRRFADYVLMRGLQSHLQPFPLGGPAFEDSQTREELRA